MTYVKWESIESMGNMAMLNVFSSNKTDTLSSLLCTKISKTKSFVVVERLPPTASACKFHSLRVSFQIMLWTGLNDQMNPCDWGWKIQNDILLLIMTDKAPAPEKLLQKIHCNCSGECTSRKCTC